MGDIDKQAVQGVIEILELCSERGNCDKCPMNEVPAGDCVTELPKMAADIIKKLSGADSCKFKIVLTAMDSNTSEEPYTEEIEGVFDSRVEAEVHMLHTMNEELSSLNEPDAYNTPHTRVFIADLDGEHDAIIRLWDGDDYWDVTYYDIVEISEEQDMNKKCHNCGCNPFDEPYRMDATHCSMCGSTFEGAEMTYSRMQELYNNMLNHITELVSGSDRVDTLRAIGFSDEEIAAEGFTIEENEE